MFKLSNFPKTLQQARYPAMIKSQVILSPRPMFLLLDDLKEIEEIYMLCFLGLTLACITNY